MLHQGLRWVTRGGTALLLAGVLAGCADSGSDASPTVPGDGRLLVPVLSHHNGRCRGAGREVVRLDLRRGRRAGGGDDRSRSGSRTRPCRSNAGCNTTFGPFEVDGTTIAWTSDPAATMMMCDPDLLEQDRWLTDLFSVRRRRHGRGRRPDAAGRRGHDRARRRTPPTTSRACSGARGPPSAPCPTAPCPGCRSTPADRGSTSERTVCHASSPGAGAVASPCRSRGRHWSSPT